MSKVVYVNFVEVGFVSNAAMFFMLLCDALAVTESLIDQAVYQISATGWQGTPLIFFEEQGVDQRPE